MGAYNPAGGSQFMNLSQVSVSQKGAAISAYGTEPTCRDEAPMSAFGDKADMAEGWRDVAYAPERHSADRNPAVQRSPATSRWRAILDRTGAALQPDSDHFRSAPRTRWPLRGRLTKVGRGRPCPT